MNTATGNRLGAFTATIMIGRFTHTFTDQTSSSISLDTNSSDVTYQSSNSQSDGRGFSVGESFYLDASDLLMAFLQSSDLDQSFTAPQPGSTSFATSGSFSVGDTNPDAMESAGFTIDSLVVTAACDVPEPTSLALLASGGVVALIGRRRLATSRAG